MALTPKEIAQIKADLAESLALQKKISETSGDYLKIIKQIKDSQKEVKQLKEAELKQTLKIAAADAKLNAALAARMASATAANDLALQQAQKEYEIEVETLKILGDILAKQQAITDELVKQAKKASQVKAIIKTTLSDIIKTKKFLQNTYNFLEVSSIFKMSKAIKTSALSMGVLSDQAESFSKDIQAAALQTTEFGVGVEDIAKIQSAYSEELGRTVMLGSKGAIALGEMASATGLGAEGASSIASSLDVVGLSAERTAKYVNQVMNDAHSMGINSSKIVKNIQNNIKLLNRYNFKKGVQGLAAMAESTTKMGVSMEMIAPMADKLFDIEGAVEMAAQLQVLGGEWSKLAEPFKLMYMARNDIGGLTDAVIKASASTAQFNKNTKEFDVSALEMQRLRKVAEATGLNFEELAQSAKKAAQFAAIKKQISFGMDAQTEKFIEATAMFDENGKAQIEVNGSPKYLNALSENDKTELMKIAAQKEDMRKRAKEAVTLDELLGNTITMLKQMAIPFVEALNKSLKPMVDRFINTIKDPAFVKTIQSVVDGIAKFVVGTAKFITEFPKAAIGLFVLFEAAKWVANGMALGLGFKMATGGMGKGGGGFGMAGLGKGAIGGLAGYGVGSVVSSLSGQESTGTGDVASLAGTVIGGIIGSFIGPAGTMIGAGIGSSIGKYLGDMFSQPSEGTKVNDGIINFNPRDKFMKVDDGTMIAGTNENGNKDLAKVLNSRVPQLPNKEALINSTQSTNVNPNVSTSVPSSMSINFGELKFTGSIELTNGQGVTADISKQLLNSPSFVRDMSKIVHIETARAVDGAFKAGPKK